MRRIQFSLLSLCLGWITCAPVAWAGDTAAAVALFRSAREAADQGDWITACDRFEESKRLEPAPGTILNLARCREKLGQVATAWQNYEEAAQRLPAGDNRAAFARRQAQKLLPRVPKLTLHAPETQLDIRVIVGDTELSSATFGVPLPFDPGKLTVTVKAPGHADSIIELELAEGEFLEHQLELGTKSAAPEEAPASVDVEGDAAAEPSSNRKTWGAVLLGVGGVGLASAAAGGIWAAIELPKVSENCENDECNDVGIDAAARGRTAVTILGVGSALAIVGGSVGAYLMLSSGSDSKVSVTPLDGGAFLSWTGTL